ncbi:MAG: hypothetical protein MI725_12880 [Pirellulales bacterium]|nr:hypothetical protein [Pirellulales bacterium]
MWCSQCQQDVPAVARQTEGPLVCPRCQLELVEAAPSRPADSGIALDRFDAAAKQDLTLPRDVVAEEESRQRLRRIGRQLRSSFRYDPPRNTMPGLPTAPPPRLPEIQVQSLAQRSAVGSARSKISWPISFLLVCGVTGFLGGSALLAWSAAFQSGPLWQWGMTTTIGAEGMLILGLTAMALRLWRNSRRLNQQLSGVDRQLHAMQEQTGALAGSRLSASQHYYHHFNQVASPHYLVANLRGQVDQLATRIAAES